MVSKAKVKILVVDDDASIRTSLAMLLAEEGYEVSTAVDGFDALLQLKRSTPDVITSDLNMPHMSGFEFLSVVRRRFPHISVIAISGAFNNAEQVPGGVIADAFHAKGQDDPQVLLDSIAELIRTAKARSIAHDSESAPVWIPRNGKDSNGVPYVVLTCTQCLRSFPLSVPGEASASNEIQQTPCLFCLNKVRYIIDFSISIASPRRESMGRVFSEALRKAAGK
ncbi:MAG TPA: response regulator [Terriglobales bacterium]|nr:response regulator [Terriglobales bacterium]